MSTERQRQHIDNVRSILTGLSGMDPLVIVQRERLGSELSFEFLVPMLTEIIGCARRAVSVDLDKVPYHILAQLAGPLQQIFALIQQISGFRPANSGNPAQERNSLANAIEDNWGSVFPQLAAIFTITESDTKRREFDAMSMQIQTSMQLSSEAAEALRSKEVALEKQLSEFLSEKSLEFEKDASESLSKLSIALEEVRKAAGEAGVTQTAVQFATEAAEHWRAANKWLGALIVVTVILVLFSLFGNILLSWAGSPVPAPNSEYVVHIRYFSQRALIISGIAFALVWVARNYGAARHNYVVNKHRNNALGSFQALVASATDDQTKNAVLIQATQSIFAPQASGYVKTDGENNTSSPILEIVRSVGSGQPGK